MSGFFCPHLGLAVGPRGIYRPSQLIHVVVTVSSNGLSAGAHSNDLGLLRSQLTNLRALLVLSILMTESADDEQILRLAVSAASALGPGGSPGSRSGTPGGPTPATPARFPRS